MLSIKFCTKKSVGTYVYLPEEWSYGLQKLSSLKYFLTIMIIRVTSDFFVRRKLGIHLRQKQAEARHGSLSSASVDSAMIRATCLRCRCDPSHRLSVDQSEASPMISPPHGQHGRNIPYLAETEKHSFVWGAPRMPHFASACLCL